MKWYELEVSERLIKKVIYRANSEEEAVEKYHNGCYPEDQWTVHVVSSDVIEVSDEEE